MEFTPMITPCQKVCRIDPERRACIGCFRTLEEIAMWPRYSDAERRAIITLLPARDPDA